MSRIRTVLALVAFAAVLAAPGTAQAVVGGTPPSDDYPFMAAMLKDGSQYCGGSLVAPQYVLTAAHCWDDGDKATEDPKLDEVQFVIGGVNLTLEKGERIGAASVQIHPDWNPSEYTHDVALVKLSSPAKAKPIPVADPSSDKDLWVAEPGLTAERKEARVIGYGLPSFDPPGALFQTDVPMVADQTCEDNYNLTGGGFDPVTMVCAGEPYGVKDSCYGDSGGPLVVSRSGDFAADDLIQVGVVSWGFLCGVPTQHGVYSRVGDNRLNDWIRPRIGSTPLEPGAITGAVTESKTRTALSSAFVDCGGAGSATTGANGSYSITGVPAGNQECTASKAGYGSKTQTVNVPSGGTATAHFVLRAQRSKGGGGKGKPPK